MRKSLWAGRLHPVERLFEAPKLKPLPSPFLLLAPPQTQTLERRASQIPAETEDYQEDQEARKEALYNIAHTTGQWYSKNPSLRLSVLSDLLLDFFILAIGKEAEQFEKFLA